MLYNVYNGTSLCDVCHRKVSFWTFGKLNSPMLKDELWEKILDRYYIYYRNWKTDNGRGCYPNGQVVCDKCMEKALRRKITKDDLLQCSLNDDYIKQNNL